MVKGNQLISSNVIIVDTDALFLNIIRLHLKEKGYTIYPFTEGISAFEYVQNHSLHDCMLLLSDFRIPGKSGLQLARKAKEVNPNLKVILMVSFEMNVKEFLKVFPSIKIDALIKKPFSLVELDALLQRLIIGDAIYGSNNDQGNSNDFLQLSKEEVCQ
jgi:DNA-binding response OmpR family regulator